MNNHFGKGLMAGLKATHADSAVNVTKFCADYKRGFVLGYSHRILLHWMQQTEKDRMEAP